MTRTSSGEGASVEEADLCKRVFVSAIKDAISTVSGKWRLAIVCALLSGPKVFSELERLMGEITPRMLSRELNELQLEGVVVRKDEQSTKTRKYELTRSGLKLEAVIIQMAAWGQDHRSQKA